VTRFHNVPLTCALLGALGLVSASASADTRPVVVELFTSQSCSSCPPADALLGELARRGDVVALGFHISYWDGLGWKDPFSSRSSTDRQRAYARLFGLGQVYTPQMVVDGAREMVGSDRDQVLAAVRDARPGDEFMWTRNDSGAPVARPAISDSRRCSSSHSMKEGCDHTQPRRDGARVSLGGLWSPSAHGVLRHAAQAALGATIALLLQAPPVRFG